MSRLPPRQRIAVIGAGIAGLSAAWLLRDAHEVSLFEAAPRAGGHADTQQITFAGAEVAVDTGFIVYNTHNYRHLTALFAHLGIATEASDMSFGVSIGNGAMEYGGGDLRQLFAQPSNALRPRFWRMLRDIRRFYREAPGLLDSDGDESLGGWLARHGYSAAFAEDHILPMGAAIWSASVDGMRDFPARHFARFFANHGLLQLRDRPRWRTVSGGSRQYVARLLADLPRVRLGCPLRALRREPAGVALHLDDGEVQHFDQAVLACHADQALALLDPATAMEAEILGQFRCQDNRCVLHTDVSLMPRRRGVWSAWNYLSEDAGDHHRRVSVTYWMNRLQGLRTAAPLLVSLNPLREPAPGSVLLERAYRHPQFDAAALRAQNRLDDIQGSARVWFAGAWTGWGFHEDGIASAVRVAGGLGVVPPWAASLVTSGAAP